MMENKAKRTVSEGIALLVERIDQQATIDLAQKLKKKDWIALTECEEYFTSSAFVGYHAHMGEMDGPRLLTEVLTHIVRGNPQLIQALKPSGYMNQKIQQLSWQWDASSKCIRSTGERFEIHFGKNIRPYLVDTGLGKRTHFDTVGCCTSAADAIVRSERMRRYEIICRKLKL